MNFGVSEIVLGIVLLVVILAGAGIVFYLFTGKGRGGETARAEGVRHEGSRDN